MHLDRGARGLTLMDEGRQRPETLAGNGQTSRNLMTGAGSLSPLLWHAISLGHMKGILMARVRAGRKNHLPLGSPL